MKLTILNSLLPALIYIFSISPLLPQEPVVSGIVSLVIGEAYYLRDGQKTQIKIKDRLVESDTVMTLNGKVRLQVGDYLIFQVSENSTVKLTAMREADQQREVALEMQQGEIYSKVAKSQKVNMKIVTPTITAGVRGTQFLVNYHEEGAAPETAQEELSNGVYVNEGLVEVTSPDQAYRQEVAAGNQVVQRNGDLQQEILDKFAEEKMRIFAEFELVKEYNYKMLEDQKEENRKMIDRFR